MNNHPIDGQDADSKITAPADAFSQKFTDLATTGYVAEFDADEAARAGAFEEDAISFEDAVASAIDEGAAGIGAASAVTPQAASNDAEA